ncbi:MAG: DUF402 domain-containing protein, partial [Clostridiales bacterium]|nr:DUF402 domain-containing protein [Clostridiales bacterium]
MKFDMGEKFRKLERTPWRRVTDRDFAFCDCPEIRGVCGLIHIIKVREPLVRTYSDGVPVAIMRDDCHWIQFAPENENFWITAMLDGDGSFVHAYFDMTDFNVINGVDSWFCDMYLDVVIKKNGEVFVLDEDELEDALSSSDITHEQYDKAIAVSKDVIKRFGGEKINQIVALCDKYYKKLSPKLTFRKIIRMNLQKEPFESIKSGEKTVEVRLYDEKRRAVHVGDEIDFECGGETIRTKAVDL